MRIIRYEDLSGRIQYAEQQPLHVKVSGIANRIRRCQAWPDGRKSVKTFAPAPLASAHFQLPVAGADIVSAGVAGYVFERSFAGNVLAFLADD